MILNLYSAYACKAITLQNNVHEVFLNENLTHDIFQEKCHKFSTFNKIPYAKKNNSFE